MKAGLILVKFFFETSWKVELLSIFKSHGAEKTVAKAIWNLIIICGVTLSGMGLKNYSSSCRTFDCLFIVLDIMVFA